MSQCPKCVELERYADRCTLELAKAMADAGRMRAALEVLKDLAEFYASSYKSEPAQYALVKMEMILGKEALRPSEEGKE